MANFGLNDNDSVFGKAARFANKTRHKVSLC